MTGTATPPPFPPPSRQAQPQDEDSGVTPPSSRQAPPHVESPAATPPPFPPPSRQAPPGEPSPTGAVPNRRLIGGAAAVAVIAIVALVVFALTGEDARPLATTPAPSTAPQMPTTSGGAAGSSQWIADVGAEIWLPTVLLAGSVVVATKDGSVLSLDRDDGTVRWRHDLADETEARVGIEPGAERGVLGAGTALMGVDLDDGHVRWRASAPGEVTEIAPLGSTAAVGGAGFAALVDVATGETMWSTDLPDSDTQFGQQRVHQIVPSRDLVLVGSITVNEADTSVWALDRRDGGVRWQLDELPIAVQLASIPDGGLVAVSWKQGVSAFAASTGDPAWHLPRSSMTWFSEVLAEGVLIGDRAGIAMLEGATGTQRWTLDDVTAAWVGGLVVASTDAGFAGLDPRTGASRWQQPGRFGPWAVTEDRVVASADDQRVVVIAAADGDMLAEVPVEGSGFAATTLYADDAGAVLLDTAKGALRYVPLPV